MKTIGLIGGMSWLSTKDYYVLINQHINGRCGGLTSAKILISSIDFTEIEPSQRMNEWRAAEAIILREAKRLESAGAQLIGICSVTGNEGTYRLCKGLRIPVIHPVDSLGRTLIAQRRTSILLLGTKYTMAAEYIKRTFKSKYGITVHVPATDNAETINGIIYAELCAGIVKEESKTIVANIITQEIERSGAEGVVLGCTELGMLLRDGDAQVPLLDATLIHARDLAEQSLGDADD